MRPFDCFRGTTLASWPAVRSLSRRWFTEGFRWSLRTSSSIAWSISRFRPPAMDIWLVLSVSAAFASIAGIAFSVGHMITSRNRLQRRLPAGTRTDTLALTSPDAMGALVGEPFKEDRFGLGQKFTKELRLKLVRAGYFSPEAVRVYVFARVCAVIASPLLVLLG